MTYGSIIVVSPMIDSLESVCQVISWRSTPHFRGHLESGDVFGFGIGLVGLLRLPSDFLGEMTLG